MYYYTKDKDGYQLNGGPGSHEVPASKEISLLYSVGEDGRSVLHKHGSPAGVQRHFDRMRTAYVAAGFTDLASELRMITSDRLPVEELNKCLDICDYLGRMVRKLEPRDADLDDFSP